MTDLIWQIYSRPEWILIIVLFLLFFIQLYFILKYFLRTLFIKPAPESIFENHISVVISVQEEEEKVKSVIEGLLAQNFSNFELIVLDDHLPDRPFEWLFNLTRKYKNIKYTGISQEVRFSEKMNINLGMKAAKSAWVVFTDADVAGRDPQWLEKLNHYISDDVDAVVAYSNIRKGKGFEQFFYRLEKMWQYLQSISFILGGRVFIADQDNVLMHKKLYFDHGGFRTYINKYYANLELVLNKELKRNRIRVAASDVAVKSEIDEYSILSFRNLVKKSMQIRHNLGFFHRFTLFFDEYSRIALIVACVLVAVFRPLYWEFLMIIPFVYVVLLMIFLGINQRRLKERNLFLSSFAYILIRPLLVLFIGMEMIIKDRRDRWI